MADETTTILAAARAVIDEALAAARRLTRDGGKGIDEHQVHAERVAYAATEVRAAEVLAATPRSAGGRAARRPPTHGGRLRGRDGGTSSARLVDVPPRRLRRVRRACSTTLSARQRCGRSFAPASHGVALPRRSDAR